jgi:hypothetical protein
VTKLTILVATWGDGLFAVTGDGCAQEIANQPVRGLAADGRGGALAIVGRHSLRRRAPSGEWTIVATSELELSCCMTVRDAIYVAACAWGFIDEVNAINEALEHPNDPVYDEKVDVAAVSSFRFTFLT